MSGTLLPVDISSLAPATQANATDIIPATQGSIGPMTGTTRGLTQAQIIAAGGTVVKSLAAIANQSVFGNTLFGTQATIDQALPSGLINPTANLTTINAAMNGKELWVNFDSIVYRTPGGDASNGGNLVGRYIGVQKQINSANVPVNGHIVALLDTTGNASSISGGLYGVEIDLGCNGNDDSSTALRRGLWISLGKGVNGSAAPQASIGIGIISGSGVPNSGSDGLGFFVPISVQTPFRDAGIDFRSAPNMAGGTGNAVWLKQGQFIALDAAGAAGVAVVKLSSDGTNLIMPESIKIGDAATIALGTDASHLVLTIDHALRFPGYSVAALPAVTAANQGSVVFSNNAISLDGGTSGVPVFMNTSGAWVTAWGSSPSTSNNNLVATGKVTLGGTSNDTIIGRGNAGATTDTSGFMIISSCSGTPTGVPTNASAGIALRYDTSAHKLWAYDTTADAWRGVALT